MKLVIIVILIMLSGCLGGGQEIVVYDCPDGGVWSESLFNESGTEVTIWHECQSDAGIDH